MIDLREALIALNAGLTQYESDGTFRWDDKTVYVIDWEEERYWVMNKRNNKFWCLKDKWHRTDGPALEFTDGRREWWQNDRLHRTDGPAIDSADGYKEWWLNGKWFDSITEWNKAVKLYQAYSNDI